MPKSYIDLHSSFYMALLSLFVYAPCYYLNAAVSKLLLPLLLGRLHFIGDGFRPHVAEVCSHTKVPKSSPVALFDAKPVTVHRSQSTHGSSATLVGSSVVHACGRLKILRRPASGGEHASDIIFSVGDAPFSRLTKPP